MLTGTQSDKPISSEELEKTYLSLFDEDMIVRQSLFASPDDIYKLSQVDPKVKNILHKFSFWEKRFSDFLKGGIFTADGIAAMKKMDTQGNSFYEIYLKIYRQIEDVNEKIKFISAVNIPEDILEQLKYFIDFDIRLTENYVKKLEEYCFHATDNPNCPAIKRLADLLVEMIENKNYDMANSILNNPALNETVIQYTNAYFLYYRNPKGSLVSFETNRALFMPLMLKAIKNNDSTCIEYLLRKKLLYQEEVVVRLINKNDFESLKILLPRYIQLDEKFFLKLLKEKLDNESLNNSIQKIIFLLAQIKSPEAISKLNKEIVSKHLSQIILDKNIDLLNALYQYGILNANESYQLKFDFVLPTQHLFGNNVTTTLTDVTRLHLAILMGDVDSVKFAKTDDLKRCTKIKHVHVWSYFDFIGDWVNKQDIKEFTVPPLQLSIIFNKPQITKLLLEKGADPTEKNSKKHSAFDVAKEMRSDKVPPKTKEAILENSFLLARQALINKNAEYCHKRSKRGADIIINGERKNYKNYLDFTFFSYTIYRKGFGHDLAAKLKGSEQLTQYMKGEIAANQLCEAAKQGELGNIFYEFESLKKSYGRR